MATTQTMSQCSLCGIAASARLNRALTCSSCIGDRCVLHSMLDISTLTSCGCSLSSLRARLATVCAQRDALRAQASVQLQLVVRLVDTRVLPCARTRRAHRQNANNAATGRDVAGKGRESCLST